MKKILTVSIVLAICISAGILQITGCKKDDPRPPQPPTCDIKGTYSGTSVASTGATTTTSYELRENNFAVGGLSKESEAVTFGGYRNTCDSVILSVFYTENSSYYLLEGKLSSDKNTISGTFKNLTNTADHGTFTISK